MALKILQVINSLATGGAEKLILETVPLYSNKDIEMDVLLLDGSRYPFYEKLESLNCCSIYSLGFKSVYNPLAIIKIMPYLKKYDIIHVHLFPVQYFVVLAKWLSFSKTKLIFTEHSTSNRRLKNFFFKSIDQFIYRGYAKIICITLEIQSIILKHSKLTNNRTEVILNGVPIYQYNQAIPYNKTQLKLETSDKLLIQVSSFQEPKDQKTLIKSVSLLPDTIKLILVKKLQLENRVFFLGVRTDVPRLLKTADLIVLSSKYEGLSLSSIEGMASGKPFIASNVPGLSEVVAGAGVLFAQGDEKELAQKITDLLKDEKQYESVAKSCLERANQYDIKKMIDKHILMYEAII
jgi:glycosyltransferase involved in cell wall biosynthesis